MARHAICVVTIVGSTCELDDRRHPAHLGACALNPMRDFGAIVRLLLVQFRPAGASLALLRQHRVVQFVPCGADVAIQPPPNGLFNAALFHLLKTLG